MQRIDGSTISRLSQLQRVSEYTTAKLLMKIKNDETVINYEIKE